MQESGAVWSDFEVSNLCKPLLSECWGPFQTQQACRSRSPAAATFTIVNNLARVPNSQSFTLLRQDCQQATPCPVGEAIGTNQASYALNDNGDRLQMKQRAIQSAVFLHSQRASVSLGCALHTQCHL